MVRELKYFEGSGLLDDMMADMMDWINSFYVDPETKCMYSHFMEVRTYVIQYKNSTDIPVGAIKAMKNFRYKKYLLGEMAISREMSQHLILYITPYCRVIFTHCSAMLDYPFPNRAYEPTIAKNKMLKRSFEAIENDEPCLVFRVNQDFGNYFLGDKDILRSYSETYLCPEDLIPSILGGLIAKNIASFWCVRPDFYNPSDAILGEYAMYKRLCLEEKPDGFNMNRTLEIFWTNTFNIVQHMMMILAVPLGKTKFDKSAVIELLKSIMAGGSCYDGYVRGLCKDSQYLDEEKLCALFNEAIDLGHNAIERHKARFKTNVLDKVRHMYV